MKIRYGFVTNSSSSSFIIGKVEETKITVDEVFSLIKDFYRDWLKKTDDFISYAKEMHEKNPNFPPVKNGRIDFKKEDKWEKREAIYKILEDYTGISHYDLYDERDISFLECETYKDYEAWATNKIKEAKAKGENYWGVAPFTIDYLNNPNPILLHNGVYPGYEKYSKEDDYEDEKDKIPYTAEIVSWYCPYSYNHDTIPAGYCKNCEDREYCGGEDAIKAINSNTELSVVERLGQVCIYSECGYIADYVVEQLGEIAHLWCNHMG